MADRGARGFFTGKATEPHRDLPGCGRVRQRFLYGIFAVAFIISAAGPVSIDATTGTPGIKSALAGHENGTGDGQGNGKGNGKGQGDENGGGKGRSGNDDDDVADDDDFGGNDDGTDPPGDAPGGGDDRADADSDIDEVAFGSSVGAVNGMSAATSAAALPTVQQIFSLDEDSVLTPEQELQAIGNGWTAPPQ